MTTKIEALAQSLTEQQRMELIQQLLGGAGLEPKAPKAVKAKAKAPATKPTTRREAIQAWKQERGITEDAQAEYKRLLDAHFNEDWAKWVAERDFTGMKLEERKEANRAEAKRIRNEYRKVVGITAMEK